MKTIRETEHTKIIVPKGINYRILGVMAWLSPLILGFIVCLYDVVVNGDSGWSAVVVFLTILSLVILFGLWCFDKDRQKRGVEGTNKQ